MELLGRGTSVTPATVLWVLFWGEFEIEPRISCKLILFSLGVLMNKQENSDSETYVYVSLCLPIVRASN